MKVQIEAFFVGEYQIEFVHFCYFETKFKCRVCDWA